ncbi:EcsC family protein [Fluviicoccus keumensis]|uniref:EcsC family protein n=1 Tax=Fluviicoccus keumensis TaxID=1435465 RepID=A0A4Q7YFH2_9GAMM|nr:EcsC family protein [Fluviicoccus keumensis]RZU35353.1 EcsC family protein [Fluviicoccus keumensis]
MAQHPDIHSDAMAVLRSRLPVRLVGGKRLEPVVSLAEKAMPVPALQIMLESACKLGERLASPEPLLRQAGVARISDLRDSSLELCESLAGRTHNRAIAMAAAEGGLTGATGMAGMVLDIPGLLTLALRTIYQVGLCYGFELQGETGRHLALRIFGLASANTVKEKEAALLGLAALRQGLLQPSLLHLRHSAATAFGRDAVVSALQEAARQLGVNLSRRKAMGIMPVIGAAVGAAVNAGFLRDVGWAARRTFQAMWMEGTFAGTAGVPGNSRLSVANDGI